jgi:phage host-nuclease inhibitor protein Gam
VADNKQIRNIRPEEPDRIAWDSADPAKSLEELRNVAELEGQKAIDWYWKAKRWKRLPSRCIQFLALFLTASAALVPVAVLFVRNAIGPLPNFDSGLLASLFVGSAAALLGLDKAFGYSSGWTRYVLTATAMTKLLHEFRMDWVALSASIVLPPTAEQKAAMIQRAKEFVSTIQGMIAQETKDWATEFQNSMAQMEKDLKAQLDALKAQIDKGVKDEQAATKPGAVELTVTNAEKTDGFSFDVVVEGQSGKSVDSVSNAKVWTRINILPGQYRMGINAKYKGNITSTSLIVDVKSGDTAKTSIALPIE